MRFLILASSLAIAAGQILTPRFEVASVRPTPPDANLRSAHMRSWGTDDGQVFLERIPLKLVIREAYGLRPYQISGPSWLDTALFDIQAIAPRGSTKEQISRMLQTLLAERFGMRAHRESGPRPAYGLVVKQATPALKQSKPGDWDLDPEIPLAGPPGGYGRVRQRKGDRSNHQSHPEFEAMSMEHLATFLTLNYSDLPVFDQTGLPGTYRVPLDLSRWDSPNMVALSPELLAEPNPDPPGYSVAESLRKLGLELVRQRVPFETLTIDSIEKTPTPN